MPAQLPDFPTADGLAREHLGTASALRALEELLPESLLVLDQKLARKQFQALADLVRTTDCYRLHFGEDVLNIPAIFDRLFRRTSSRRMMWVS